MKRRSLLFKIIMLTLAVAPVFCGGLKAQNLADITRPPTDSADAVNLRIWYGIERISRCQVSIEITDMARHPIRKLLNQPMGKGYYNFFWDKKDDSGRYVEPGTYLYIINDCGKVKYGNLKVRYRPWENTGLVTPDTLGDTVRFRLELLEDSASVSLKVYKGSNTLVAGPITDSLMNRGEYVFTWKPDDKLKPGLYTFKWSIGGFIREFKVSYKR